MPKIFELLFSPDLVDMIDDSLYNEFQPVQANTIYPSLLGGCLRKLVLGMTRRPPKPPKKEIIKMLRAFEDGKERHKKYRRLFQKMGILVDYETKLSVVDNANGKPDYIIKKGDKEVVVELKGVGAKYWSKIPFEQDEIQLTYYDTRLNKDYGILLYENKDTCEPKEFPVGKEKEPEVARRLQVINRHLKAGTLPEREYPSNYFKCRNCVWRRLYCD